MFLGVSVCDMEIFDDHMLRTAGIIGKNDEEQKIIIDFFHIPRVREIMLEMMFDSELNFDIFFERLSNDPEVPKDQIDFIKNLSKLPLDDEQKIKMDDESNQTSGLLTAAFLKSMTSIIELMLLPVDNLT